MRTELKYGVMFAGIVVVYVMLEHLLGINTTRHDIGQYSRLAGVLVPIVGIFFGIKAKRDKELNGTMRFWQGVKTGFLIAVIQTTLTTLWFLFYGRVINPQFFDSMLEFERSRMIAAGPTGTACSRRCWCTRASRSGGSSTGTAFCAARARLGCRSPTRRWYAANARNCWAIPRVGC